MAKPDDDFLRAMRDAPLDDDEDERFARALRDAPLETDDDFLRKMKDAPLDGPPPQKSAVFQASRMAQSSVQKALAGMPNGDDADRFYSGLDKITDPENQDAVRAKGEAALKATRQLRRAANEGEGREATLRDAVPGLVSSDPIERNQAFMDTQRAAATAVAYPLQATLGALDTVFAKPVRTAFSYGLNLPQTPDSPPEMRRRPMSAGKGTFGADYLLDPVRLAAAEEMAGSSEDYSRAIIDAADQGGIGSTRSAVAGLSTLPGRALGSLGGAALTAGMAPIAALTEVRPMMLGETDVPTVANNLWALAKQNNRAMQEFGVAATHDLSSALTFGNSTAARNGLRAVLASTGDEALAKGVSAALTRTAGTIDQIPAVVAEFEKVGKTAADAEAIFGPNLRHLGSPQLEVGVPFTQMSTPIDSTYSFRRWLGQSPGMTKAVDTAADVIGANRVYDRTPDYVHAERRKGLAIEAKARDELAAKVRSGIEALPAPIRKAWSSGKKWRQEFYTRAIRPDFERARPGDAVPTPLGRTQIQVPDEKGGFHTLTAAEDYVPYDQLDAVFGTGARQLFDLIRDTHEQARTSLVGAGYMPEAQAAKDPFSGIYMRRPVQSKNGLFDEVTIAAKQSAPSRGMNAIRKNRVGAEDGFPGGLSRSEMDLPGPNGEPFMAEQSTDPAQLWADYARLYGRAEGETVFRQNVADRFGREVQPGDTSTKNLGVSVQSIRTPAYSPGPGEVKQFAFDPQVANIMDQAFAPGSGKLSRIVRNAIPGETPLGRGAIRGAELWDSAQSVFKRNVLASPAYQATNFYNDTTRDMLEGNLNPFAEQSVASQMMRGETGPLKMGALDTTLEAELRAAQAAGLPLDLEASHRFDLDPAGGLARDFVDAARDPSVARTAWRTLMPPELGGSALMRRLGERNEALQKSATYLRWRSLGASPEEAVSRAMASKIDYQWRNPAEQALSIAVPFSKYISEAPRRTARTMLRRPGSVGALDDFYSAFDQEEDVVPRDSLQQTRFLRLGGEHARLASNMIRELGAGVDAVFGDPSVDRGPPVGIPEGYSPIAVVKDDTFDSMRPFQSAEQFGATLATPARAIIEALAKTQLATGRDQEPPALDKPFPWASGFPDDLTANANQVPWATAYLPNYVPVAGARGFQLFGNMALGMDNNLSPLTVFGGSRAYAPETDRRAAYAHQALNYLLPMSLYAEEPASALQNMDRRMRAGDALDNHRAAQKTFRMWLEGADGRTR